PLRFFFTAPFPPRTSTLSLHDALPISGNSLPGDPLYPIKLGVERAQLAITFDPAARARLHAQFADVRLSEAQRLVAGDGQLRPRSEEHTSELQSPYDLVCRLLLEKKNK